MERGDGAVDIRISKDSQEMIYEEDRMDYKEGIEDKIHQLEVYADKNDNIIWYDRVVDILYDKDNSVTDEVIEAVVCELEKKGITVERKQDEDYVNDSNNSNKFIPADVNISQRPLNVYNLMERLINHEINMAPGFQRHGVWTKEQQSRLIESLILKIPIPTFYFNAVDEGEWVVIDGLQRMTAFNDFLVGKKNEKGEGSKKSFAVWNIWKILTVRPLMICPDNIFEELRRHRSLRIL